MKKRLSIACNQYGASLGRRNSIPDDINTASKLYLEKLRWVGRDYDEGGCYWGNTGKDDVYMATGESETEVIEIFVRASDRDGAKQQVREVFKEAKFFR
jgi:hypothetical protein